MFFLFLILAIITVKPHFNKKTKTICFQNNFFKDGKVKKWIAAIFLVLLITIVIIISVFVCSGRKSYFLLHEYNIFKCKIHKTMIFILIAWGPHFFVWFTNCSSFLSMQCFNFMCLVLFSFFFKQNTKMMKMKNMTNRSLSYNRNLTGASRCLIH